MLKNRLLYAAALVGAVVFHSYYTGWLSWFLLLFALCLPLLSLLCSLPCILSQNTSAQMPASCPRGENAMLRLENGQRSAMPALPCRLVLECTDMAGGCTQSQAYRFAAWKKRNIVLDTQHCGAYPYRFAYGKMTDYLGIFSFRMRLPELGTMYVLPLAEQPSPLPNLSRFQARIYQPKHGGGFSEIHDLREYRPGDSMQDVHWKLSAKTDDLIVREALEPGRRQVLLTLDLKHDRTAMDETLDILMWMSQWLLAHETAHIVCWLDPKELEPVMKQVSDESDLQEVMKALLSAAPASDAPSIAGRPFPAADWRYHIRPSGEVTE